MLLRYFYDKKLAHASYLVGCQKTGEAIVIDPGRNLKPYLQAAKEEGLTSQRPQKPIFTPTLFPVPANSALHIKRSCIFPMKETQIGNTNMSMNRNINL